VLAPIRDAVVTWGFTGSAFDCWLAARGMNTLELRVTRAAGCQRCPNTLSEPPSTRREELAVSFRAELSVPARRRARPSV
jgi:O-acetylhomoserine/O-acetylserine sulfhydrylase-like pyridoxal-dependent enzyme